MSPKKETSLESALKVLIADDVTTNRTLASKLMIRRGHRVIAVEDGLQAYEAFLKEIFDVILMDIQMPVMDGLEATRKIRAWEKISEQDPSPPNRQKRIPIIALTANDDDSARTSYHQAGMDAVITKPLDVKSVLPLIRSLIGNANHTP